VQLCLSKLLPIKREQLILLQTKIRISNLAHLFGIM
jgi:hypothetical protein